MDGLCERYRFFSPPKQRATELHVLVDRAGCLAVVPQYREERFDGVFRDRAERLGAERVAVW
jgi:hypothetical protein